MLIMKTEHSSLESAVGFHIPMSNIPASIHLYKQSVTCPRCGSPWRLGEALCLKCLLAQGLVTDLSGETSAEGSLEAETGHCETMR